MAVFCTSFPIIVVGLHFTAAIVRYRARSVVSDWRKTTVSELLEEVNEMTATDLFQKEDELVFLTSETNLNSRRKVEQILIKSGWWTLPFARRYSVGIPRVSQFKLFVLYGVFGKRYQNFLKADRRYKNEIKYDPNPVPWESGSIEDSKVVEDIVEFKDVNVSIVLHQSKDRQLPSMELNKDFNGLPELTQVTRDERGTKSMAYDISDPIMFSFNSGDDSESVVVKSKDGNENPIIVVR